MFHMAPVILQHWAHQYSRFDYSILHLSFALKLASVGALKNVNVVDSAPV